MPPRAASPPGKGAKGGKDAKAAAPAGPTLEQLATEVELHKQLSERRRVEAAEAVAAATAERARAASHAADRDDVLEHARRELAAAQAKAATLEARAEELTAEIAATEAECAAFREEAQASLACASERDRLLTERAAMDEAGRATAAHISRQVEEAAAAAETAATLRERLADAHARVDALTLHCRGGTALRVYFGAPWLVTTATVRLSSPPHAARGASLCALPAAEALVLFGGHAPPEDDADVAAAAASSRFGEAFCLSMQSCAWARAPGGRHAGRVGHASASLPGSGAVAPGAAGAAGGVVAVLGGRAAAPGGAQPQLCADVALLASGVDGALRWLCAAADADAEGAPPPREGAAACATPAGDRVYLFGGADAAGALTADVACLDVASMMWLPPPSGGAVGNRSGRLSATGRLSQTGGGGNRLSSTGSFGRRSLGGGSDSRSPSPSRRGSMSGDAPTAAGGAATLSRLPSLAGTQGAAWQAPRPRTGAALASDADGSTLWLFGGAVAGGAVLNDLYSYDTDSGAWTARQAALGDAPPPRTGAAAAVAGHYLLIGGGTAADGVTSLHDAWALDTNRLVWECLLEGDAASAGGVDAAAQPPSFATWRGRTLCLLRASGDSGHNLDLLETTEFALPDDIDALISSRRAAGGDGGAATLALWCAPLRGSTWLDVAWRPPARHAERITGYKLMMAPAGAASVRTVYSGRGCGARVGGLRPGTEYVCVVKASYNEGSHVWSDTRAFRTARLLPPREPPPDRPPFDNMPSRLGQPTLPRPRTASGSEELERRSQSPPRGASRGASPRRGGVAPAQQQSSPLDDPLDDDEGGPAPGGQVRIVIPSSSAASAASAHGNTTAAVDLLSERMMAVLEGRLRGDDDVSDDEELEADASAAAAAWDAGEDDEAVVIEDGV